MKFCTAAEKDVLTLSVLVHACRHVLLFLRFYGPLRDHQKEKIKSLRALILTHGSLIKLHSQGPTWSKHLPPGCDRTLHIDEMQRRGDEEVAAMVFWFDNFIGTGDGFQRPWQLQRLADLHPAARFGSEHSDDVRAQPLLWNNSVSWAEVV